MINPSPISALIDYYGRLDQDPDRSVPQFGFCPQNISFCIVLEEDGKIANHPVIDLRENMQTEADKTSLEPVSMVLPYRGERTSGILPFPFWDKTDYLLGVDADGKEKHKQQEASRDFNTTLAKSLNSQRLRAVAEFLTSWNPDQVNQLPNWQEMKGKNLIFTIRGEHQYVHEDPVLKAYWPQAYRSEVQKTNGISLVTGEVAGVVAKHEPPIKGVVHAKTTGAKIASFNEPAYASFGKGETSCNAPTSEDEAFQYTTALNHLLRDGDHRVRLGDATVAFWSDRPTPFESMFGSIVSEQAHDPETTTKVQGFLTALRRGRPHEGIDDPSVPFYILGLSPNASRISIRFWLAGTVGQFAERLARHVADLEMAEWYSDEEDAWLDDALRDKPKDKWLTRLKQISQYRSGRQSQPLSIYAILGETVPAKKGYPDRDRINPRLAGEISRSILEGTPLPRSLWTTVLNRVLTDGMADPDKRKYWRQARHRRAAILRACLNQSIRKNPNQESHLVDTHLDKTHPNPAYHCGRLMAVLAFSQEQALGQVNASVVRRYLSGVVAAPGTLGRLQVHAETGHIPKLEGNLPSMVRDELKQINCAIGSDYPRTFDQTDQSYFVLGFYQQMAWLDTMRSTRRHRWRTNLGEWVRSKGERHVANALAAAGVHYVYEPRAILDKGQDRVPDFLVPHGEESKNVYIEYLGMNTPEYNQRWEVKLREYQSCDISEAGGSRGRLVIIDDREEGRDQPAIMSFLIQSNVIERDDVTTTDTPPEESTNV